MSWKTIGLSLTLATALTACGPKTDDKPVKTDTSQAEVKTGLSNIQVVKAKDGYSAWLVTEPSIPIVAVNMSWKGGATSDPEGLAGVAGLMTYMMNEGAGDLDSNAFATRMEELNMSFGCSSGTDWVSCSMSTLSANFEDAMELVRLGLTETRFDEAPFERAIEETMIGLKQGETSPGVIASHALIEALYPADHPYAVYETPESVEAITIDDLRARKDALLTRGTLLVTAVGDIEPDRLNKVMQTTFADLPETGSIAEFGDVVLKPAAAEPIVKLLPQPQSRVVFVAPGLKRDDPDFFAAYVTNYILGGGGFSARLMDEIREKRGLTYGIYSSLGLEDHLGTWNGSAQTANENAGELIGRTKAELYKMATDGPTQKELEDAKSYLTGAYPLSFDSNAKIAGAMMSIRQEGLGLDYIATRNDMVEAVTLDDVKRVAATYLKPENFTFIVVGQPEGMDEIEAFYEDSLAPEPVETAEEPAIAAE